MVTANISGHDPETESRDELVRAALDNYDDNEKFEHYANELSDQCAEDAFDIACRLIRHRNPHHRVLGAAILSRVGARHCAFVEKSIHLLIPLLKDQDIDVATVAANSLGSCETGRGVCPELYGSPSGSAEPLIAASEHPSEGVRQAVAYALGSIELSESELPADVLDRLRDSLVRLAADVDRDVRWEAMLALAYVGSSYDTEDIRSTLRQHVCDEDYEVRGLALVGLAERHDPQVVDLLIRELRSGGPVSDNTISAAGIAADPRLLPILIQLRDAGFGEHFIGGAIEDCSDVSPEE